MGGPKLFGEGVAERDKRVGARRVGQEGWGKGGAVRGCGKGGKGVESIFK